MKTNLYKILKLSISSIPLILFNSATYGQDPVDFIIGKWKYVKDLSFISCYSEYNLEDIRNSILHIEKDKVFFDSPAGTSLFDPCNYQKISIESFSERDDPESNIYEARDLLIQYTKEEIMKLIIIKFNCKNNCLGSMYLKQDTLILNSCGGVTLFFIKYKQK